MGNFDPVSQQIIDVDPVETFTGDLYEYEFPSTDPEDKYIYRFYDVGGNDLSYTMMGVLEYYHRHKRSIRVTIQDDGESQSETYRRKITDARTKRRAEALVKLKEEHRSQHIETYRTI